MKRLYGFELLKYICDAFGPSGCEGEVRGRIREQLTAGGDSFDSITCDRLGNLIACIKGNGGSDKPLMIAAHMDEVGFMITHIDGDGYLHFGCVGGIDPRVLCGRRVVIGDEIKRVPGIIASKAIHQQSPEERRESTPVKRMYIDIGAKNKADAEKFVSVGDFGTFAPEFKLFGEDDRMIVSKAIDDRLGCSVMIEIMRELYASDKRPDYDIYFAFTVREEVGLSGSLTASYAINPDKAIVLESTAIADLAGVDNERRVADTGEGGVISIADRSAIYDRHFVDLALECAKNNGIKAQVKRYLSGGNDAGHIHKNRAGVKTLAISAPCRYLHTASNVINNEDYKSIHDLVMALIASDEMNF